MAANNIRKYGIILAVAVLFSIFVFSLADAITPEKEYPQVCQQSQTDTPYYAYREPVGNDCEELFAPTQEQIDACPGRLYEDYSKSSCATEYTCDCYQLQEKYQREESNVIFWIAVVLGFIAIAAGMLLPSSNELNEWVGAGFILGGLITLFIATAMHWGQIDEWARPLVIAIELGVVLWIAYRKFSKRKK